MEHWKVLILEHNNKKKWASSTILSFAGNNVSNILFKYFDFDYFETKKQVHFVDFANNFEIYVKCI